MRATDAEVGDHTTTGPPGRSSADENGSGRWPPLPRQRTRTDLIRVALGGLLVVAAAAIAAQASPTSLQVNAFRMVNQLPSFVGPGLEGTMQLGALGAVAVFAVVVLLSRRPRLAPLIIVAGTTSWAVARLLQNVIDEDPPILRVSRVILHGASAPGFAFPSTHVAVAAALATIARGELPRPARRLAWILVAVVAVARVYVGAHLPIDVLGGFGVGWCIGGAVNFAIGVRPALPNTAQLSAALAQAGRPAITVRMVRVGHDDAARFVVDTQDGPRLIKAVGADDPESDWLRLAWRFVAFREVRDDRSPTNAAHRVDHEAYVSLLAERAGVRVAPVLASWSAGNTEFLEREWVEGDALQDITDVDDRLLDDIWEQLGRLEDIRVAHNVAPSTQVVVDDRRQPRIVEFGRARVGASPDDIAMSRAAALVDLALLVGAERATASLVRSRGAQRAGRTLEALQLVELPGPLRSALTQRPEVLTALHREIASIAKRDPPPITRPVRVAARNLLPAAALGIAVFVVLAHLGQAGSSVGALTSADPIWLLAATAAAGLTYVMSAAVVVSSAPVRLGFGRTVAAQFAAASANRASPAGLGGMALNMRYLEMSGASRTAAGGAIAVNSATAFVIHTALTSVLVVIVGSHSTFRLGPDLDQSWRLLVGVIAISTVIGVAVWSSRLHHRLAAFVRTASSGARLVARTPWRLALLVAASAGISFAYAAALEASIVATGGHLEVARVLVVYFAASAVAAVAPTPGGLGPLEAALIAGLSQQGLAAGPAVAAVLSYRLLTYWLPVLPGLVCLGVLRRARSL